jgi:hypothetical protein
LIEAKRIAVEQHNSLKGVVEDGLRFLLSTRHQERHTAATSWPISSDAKPVPGVDLSSTSALMDLIETP